MGGVIDDVFGGGGGGALKGLINPVGAIANAPFGGGGNAGGAAQDSASAAAQAQAEIARKLFGQTQPLRDRTFGALSSILSGGNPLNLRVFAPAREAISDQFGQAREQILGTTGARGGQLSRALIGLETDRARATSGLEARLRENAFNQALSVDTGSIAPVLSGFGGAANTFQSAANAQQQAQATQKAGLGQGVGTLIGLGIKGCWIAAALYGEGSPAHLAARHFVFEVWTGPVAAVTRRLYLALGPWAARQRWLLPLLKPLFDRAVARGREVD